VLVLLGLLSLWWRKRVGHELQVMASTPASTAAQAATATPGTFVKVIGTLRCREPIKSEFSYTPCAYFHAEIEREEVYYERGPDGKEQRKTRTTTIHANTQNAACAIADNSGMVGIDFKGANVEAIEVMNQIGNPNGPGGLMGVIASMGSTSDRYKERILAPDSPIYVLATSLGNQLLGAAPQGARIKTFVISHKSEAQRIKDLGSTMHWAIGLAIALFALAAASLYGAWRAGA